MRQEWDGIFSKGIMAMVPQYEIGIGDTTIIYHRDGSITKKNHNINSVIKSIGRYFLVDLKESKRYYSEFLGIRKNLPLVFDQNTILMSVKTRIPIAKNDGAMSYVNYRFVKEINHSLITFDTGESLQTLTSNETLMNYQRNFHFIYCDFELKEKSCQWICDEW